MHQFRVCTWYFFQLSDLILEPVDSAVGDGGEKVKHGLPIMRRGGCTPVLGFDCGSASRPDAGLVGKVVRLIKSF